MKRKYWKYVEPTLALYFWESKQLGSVVSSGKRISWTADRWAEGRHLEAISSVTNGDFLHAQDLVRYHVRSWEAIDFGRFLERLESFTRWLKRGDAYVLVDVEQQQTIARAYADGTYSIHTRTIPFHDCITDSQGNTLDGFASSRLAVEKALFWRGDILDVNQTDWDMQLPDVE